MAYWSKQHRAFAVECYFRVGESVVRVQREFRKHFKIQPRYPIPARGTILNWVKNFRETASASNRKSTGPRKTVRTPENIERMITRHDMHEGETLDIKTEVDDENGECIGQSSFDLALNNPDILQLVSNRFLEAPIKKESVKEENVTNEERSWLNAVQEKQLASILNENGWYKLAQHFNIDYLLESVENSYNATLLLLSYITLQTKITLEQLQSIMNDLNLEDAATYLSQILSMQES